MKPVRFLTHLGTSLLAGMACLQLPLQQTLNAAEPAGAAVPKFGDASPLEWSTRMARSQMARDGDGKFFQEGSRARWEYTMGLLSLSYVKLADVIGDEDIRKYGENITASFIAPDGTIRTYRQEEYNIDMMPPGKVVLWLYEKTGEERFKKAAAILREQLAKHPRTSEGGFWHKQRYPYQMWLDGIYMGAPFYAQYGKLFNEPADVEDAIKQIILMDRHGWDPVKGLHYHAWDEKRAQSWANKETGTSPSFWGRSVGWYAMAIVDTLDFVPAVNEDLEAVVEILRRVAEGIERYQDPKTGLWWQVVDQGGREGNYLEATASTMFVYALAKAINKGYLPRDRYLPVVQKGYAGIIRDLIRKDADGSVNLLQCCAVAGLGYTTTVKGVTRPRDGTYEYYLFEPVIENDLKGVGPFILAGIEVEHLFATVGTPQPLVVTGWESLPAVLARIQAPVFPDRDFAITDFGAVPDDKEDDSEAIAKAIDAANAAGGGRVVLPKGVTLTGAVRLKSNVNLHVPEGATLRWDPNPAKYPVVLTRWEGVECMNFSPLVYAYEQENIAVTGKGTLDGGASMDNWWSWNDKRERTTRQKADRDKLNQMGEAGVPVEQRVFGPGHFLRPKFIQPYRCKNILIEGVTIINSPMWEVTPALSQNITVRGLTIVSHGSNNDGCDPESCADVLIENCTFDTGDDCIAIKSGRNNDGRRINVPSENIVVRNCVMKDGHGGVVIGSEISGGCRNVFVENCTMDSPNLDRGLRFKSNARRGGVIENVFMRNVKIGRVAEAVLTIDLQYEEGANGPHKPVVRNVGLENVTSSASPRVMWIAGFEGATIDRIRFTDCTFSGVEQTEVVSHVGTITFDNVTIVPLRQGRSANSPTADRAGN